ncbi:MAG: MarR family transcriptional regulator [Bacilli bacterium]|nr:MarR family transcriptional regulator [Bacilli bacterium]NCC68466.1 MarR family transcriptional regulator [Clostridia bacterium]
MAKVIRNQAEEKFRYLVDMTITYMWPQTAQLLGGFSTTQYAVLFELHSMKKANLTTLAAQVGITKQTMTGISAKLVQEGYITRVYSEKNRRQIEVQLTEKGIIFVENARKRSLEYYSTVFQALTDEEMEEFLAHTEALSDLLQKTAFGEKFKYKNNK